MEWQWKIKDVAAYKRRCKEAKKANLLSVDSENGTAEFLGSTPGYEGLIYQTSLTRCTCSYFEKKYDVCKHIVRLGMELGLIDTDGDVRFMRPDQLNQDYEKEKELLALWDSQYQNNSPIVSDREYDELKERLIRAGVLSRSQQTETVSENTHSIHTLRAYLNQQRLEYIDKTPQGGSLYFFDDAAKAVFEAMGFTIKYAPNGTRATKHKPAWYVKIENS